MTTLFATMLNLAKLLGPVREGVSTAGGGQTAMIDTLCLEPNDYWNDGVLFFIDVPAPATSSKSATITDWALSTGTFTFPALGFINGTDSGDRYVALAGKYTRTDLIEAVNLALADLGPIPAIDTTLTTVANQESYTLPAGVAKVTRMEIASSKGAVKGYQTNYHWQEIGGTLYFDNGKQPSTSGYTIRLTYLTAHAVIGLDDDVVTDTVHPMRIAWTAAYHVALKRSQVVENDDPSLKDFLALASAKMNEMAIRHPVRMMGRDPHHASW